MTGDCVIKQVIFVFTFGAAIPLQTTFTASNMNGIEAPHEFFAWKLFQRLVYNARLNFPPSHP